MMARGRNLAALGALLGAGALAASRKNTTGVSGDGDAKKLAFLKQYADTNLKMTPGEEAAVRRRALAEEPGGRQLFVSEEGYPVSTGSGKFLRSGMKKGGIVSSASKRADGAAKRGKTRGKMV